jgi:type VI secretion system protein VasD
MKQVKHGEDLGLGSGRAPRALGRWHGAASVSALLLSLLSACASAPTAAPATPAVVSENSSTLTWLGGFKDKALGLVGIKPPEAPATPATPDVGAVPDSALPDRRISLKIYASPSLNVSDDGQALGLVVRIYRLRSADSFQSALPDVFGDKDKEKEAFGAELVSAREVVIKPGLHYETVDKFGREARFIGIVALFRKPAEGRWRQVFDAARAEITGIGMGAHACALSVQVGQPIGEGALQAKWSGASCPR